jgi:hypothetical protein
MKFSVLDEQETRKFALDNPDVVGQVIPKEGRTIAQDNFFADPHQVQLFVGFCKSLADVSKDIVSIGALLGKAATLFKWVQGRFSSKEVKKEIPTLALRERLLILLFEAYAQSQLGIKEAKLTAVLGEDASDALKELKAANIIRRAADGSWKYRPNQ